jgi:hypothetical protein
VRAAASFSSNPDAAAVSRTVTSGMLEVYAPGAPHRPGRDAA